MLRQPWFTYSACRPFVKHHKRIKKIKETGSLKYISKNELDKACFAHDAAYMLTIMILANRTVSDKVLKERAYEIAIKSKLDTMVIKED